MTALDERSFQWICPFRENEGSARSLDALFFFFFHGTAFIPISKGICSTPPASCSIDLLLYLFAEQKIGIYLSTMYNFFPPPPRICPRSLIFHDETIFEGDETRRAQSPGKGLKFNDTNLRRGINLSFSNFSVLLLGQGSAMYDPLIFNLLLKISFTSPSSYISSCVYERIRGPAFRSPAFTLRVAHLCIV